MVASSRYCRFCIDLGTLDRAATNRFLPRWKRPVNSSPISDAMDLHGAPLQENRRANPSNAPCLRRVLGDVRLMNSDAKELGHYRAADRPFAYLRLKRSHTFLQWQLIRECYRAGLRREQICLWFAGYAGRQHQRRAAMSAFGAKQPLRRPCILGEYHVLDRAEPVDGRYRSQGSAQRGSR